MIRGSGGYSELYTDRETIEFVRKKTQYILFAWGTSISFVTGDGVVGAHQQADQEQQQHPTSDGGSSAPIPGCGTKS